MKLLDLAKIIVSSEDYIVPDDTPTDVDAKYQEKMTGTIRLFKPTASRLGLLCFPFIDNTFKNGQLDVEEVLKTKIDGDELPDSLFQGLSMGIYKKLYSELSNDERSIIKLLGVYIIISTK